MLSFLERWMNRHDRHTKRPPSLLEQVTLDLNFIVVIGLMLIGLKIPYYEYLTYPTIVLLVVGIFCSLAQEWNELQASAHPLRWMASRSLEIGLLVLTPPLLVYHNGWLALLGLRQLLIVVRIFLRWDLGQRFLMLMLQHPAKLMVFSFGGLILLGALILTLPAATTDGVGLHTIDAFFTSTSATCVTGLIVADTPKDFTLFGQLTILTLIQIGGLGIMTISSFIMWSLGRRIGLRGQQALGAILDEPTPAHVLRLLRFIILVTIAIEGFGALLLFIRWYTPSKPMLPVLYQSIFHAISAFCNAGFALWSNSLMNFQHDVLVNFTIIALILLGGMGFPVLGSILSKDSWKRFKTDTKRHSFLLSCRIFIRKLPLNTKIVLITQFVLVTSAFALFFWLESGNSLQALSTGKKALSSFFQAVTLRTAGFNSMDFSLLTSATLFMMIFYMFIGGASGGTAGGIKLNTLAVVFLYIRSMLRGRQGVEVFHRAVPRQTVLRATAIITIFVSIFLVAFFMLLVTQSTKIPFVHLMFESVSALGTVGLSVSTPDGISTTSKLNDTGKLLIILLMFVGRLGPLTLAFAIGRPNTDGQYQYPRERIYVG